MEAGQLCAGYAGVLLYGFAACALSVALFSLCARSGAANSVGVAVPLLVSVLVLLLANSVHKLPQYVQAGAALSFCARAVSFSWHFDAASKGVFDSRDIFFYMIAAFALLLVSAAAEYRRTGRKISRLTALLAVLLCATLAVAPHYLLPLCGAEKSVSADGRRGGVFGAVRRRKSAGVGAGGIRLRAEHRHAAIAGRAGAAAAQCVAGADGVRHRLFRRGASVS